MWVSDACCQRSYDFIPGNEMYYFRATNLDHKAHRLAARADRLRDRAESSSSFGAKFLRKKADDLDQKAQNLHEKANENLSAYLKSVWWSW